GAVAEGALTLAPHQLRDVHEVAREDDLHRSLHVSDLAFVAPLRVEHLDPVALPVAHEHPTVAIDGDPVRQHELAGAGARLAPRREELALRGEAMDGGVPVAVGDG